MPKQEFVCDECGKKFEKYENSKRKVKNKFCCNECRDSWYKKNYYTELTCEFCGKKYFITKGQAKNGNRRFCSRQCSVANLQKIHIDKKIKVKCDCCGKEYEKYLNYKKPNKNNFCSQECYKKFIKSDFGYNTNYRNIAFKNYERECEVCKIKLFDECLEVHHIDENRKNNEVNNLIILCPTHHRMLTSGWAEINENREFKILNERKIKKSLRKENYLQINEEKLKTFLNRLDDLEKCYDQRKENGFKTKMAVKWGLTKSPTYNFIRKIDNMINMGMTFEDIRNEKEKYFKIVYEYRRID